MSERGSGRDRAAKQSGDEERLEVLNLLRAGDITADEAAQLLDALERAGGPRAAASAEPAFAARGGGSFRIRVSDSATGRAGVNLSLPLGLLDAGVAVARRFAPDRVPDPAVVRDALANGLRGRILDVDNEGERVEIWVE
jgi:hypothetical protein